MNSFLNKAVKKAHKMNEEALLSLVNHLFNEYSLLDALVDSIQDGVIILDAKNKVVKVNKNLFLILSIPRDTREKTQNLKLEDIFTSMSIREAVESTILNQEKCQNKEFIIQENENNKYIELSILPLVKHKTITGSIIIVADITEKKIAELKTSRLESLARLTTAAASISHEIKNPLAAISIHVQLLEKMLLSNTSSSAISSTTFTENKLDDHVNEKIKKHFKVIEEEIERLNKIVVDFLFAVRPMKFQISCIDINALLSSLVETFQEECNNNNIKICTQFSKEMPHFQGDERFIRQAFMNIILNAKNAMENSGGILEIKTFIQDASIIVEFSDSGVGIPPSLMEKIFEPYFTTKSSGTGLGLTLTYKVIKEHGGDIYVCSNENKGALFKVVFPLEKNSNLLLLSCDKK